jgi:hypothetical protein
MKMVASHDQRAHQWCVPSCCRGEGARGKRMPHCGLALMLGNVECQPK